MKIDSVTCERTSAIRKLAMIWRHCSTARTPPAEPYETNATGLPVHSEPSESTAFFNAPGTPWLYSGVTNTKPSHAPIAALQRCTWGES